MEREGERGQEGRGVWESGAKKMEEEEGKKEKTEEERESDKDKRWDEMLCMR